MKKIILISISCLISLNLLAQSEAANWYFGFGGGIKFNQNNNTVSSVNDGQLFTNEDFSFISNSYNNLLKQLRASNKEYNLKHPKTDCQRLLVSSNPIKRKDFKKLFYFKILNL